LKTGLETVFSKRLTLHIAVCKC